MIGTLIRGRISIAAPPAAATKRRWPSRWRYGDSPPPVRAPGRRPGGLLNDYLAHQRKLLPALATTYALSFAQHELVTALGEVRGRRGPVDEHRQRELESRAAGLKAVSTWHATRDHPGLPGGVRRGRLPGREPAHDLKADTDVFTTFEGDNTVLLQLVAKGLLTNYQSDFADLARWPRPRSWPRSSPAC